MAAGQELQIITVYSASRSRRARLRLRTLSVLSLVVAGGWLYATAGPIDSYFKRLLFATAIARGSEGMSRPQAGAATATGQPPTENASRVAISPEAAEREARFTREMSILAIESYAWWALALLAGGWLALAGLIGLTGSKVALRLHRQAAVLILLSTAASLAGIWVAADYGGLDALEPVIYAKIGGLQSAYAWFLLIATRIVR